MMQYYPVFLDIRGKGCLVVGGGGVAHRKVRSLLEAGAAVRVVSPRLTPALERLAERRAVKHAKRGYRTGDLTGSSLVFVATDDRELNVKIYEEATRRKILCNVVDIPELCHFIVPSSLSRGGLQLAISTSGKSPALAREIRIKLEKAFGKEYALYLDLLGRMRREILKNVSSPAKRRRIFKALSQGRILSYLKAGKRKEAFQEARRIIQKHS